MADDVERKERRLQGNKDLKLSEEQKKNTCLKYIEDMLLSNNKSLKNILGMPYPEDEFTMEGYNRLIHDDKSYDPEKIKKDHDTWYPTLTGEQKQIYSPIMEAVNNNKGGMFFVYGYGGTGKTYLYKTITAGIRSKGDIVLNVASSGIAALLLEGGRTTHSRFAIPLNILNDSVCHIAGESRLAELIRHAKLIIWDEAPMIQSYCYEAFEMTLRDTCRQDPNKPSELPFGGKVVVFGGDFRQILPVIPNATRNEVVHATINSSPLWEDCTVLELTMNMRLTTGLSESEKKEIQDFPDWILGIGNGDNDPKNEGQSTIVFPDEMLIPETDDYVKSITEEIYPNLNTRLYSRNYFQERAILAPTHEMVDLINEKMMILLPGEETIYESSDSVSLVEEETNFDHSIYTQEFLNEIKMSGLPKHAIKLKIGTPVMLMRNIDQKAGLCNGTRLQVFRTGKNLIEGGIISGSNVGKRCAIPIMIITPTDKKMPFKLNRRQFPIQVCFPMTINKSQGKTLKVGLFLTKPVFSHGQLYVAVSRVEDKKGLKVLCLDNEGNHTKTTTNVVYKEVLYRL